MFNYKNISSTPGITNELNMGEECQGEAQRGDRERERLQKMKKTC